MNFGIRRNKTASNKGTSNIKKKEEIDEDLVLFKQLESHKREKERIMNHLSLLQPVSDDFEPTGNHHQLYKIPSGKKDFGSFGFLGGSGKHDYDWLKTPPATPLFPSLEIEAKGPEHVIQREITILQPLSRFAASNGNSVPPKSSNIGVMKSPDPRLITETKNNVKPKPKPKPKPKSNMKSLGGSLDSIEDRMKDKKNITINVEEQKQISHGDHLVRVSNSTKSIGTLDHKTKNVNRSVSPLVKSSISTKIKGFSNDTPPNLRTDQRATSAIRTRAIPTTQLMTSRRQSCSPSITRGRKLVEAKQEISADQGNIVTINTSKGKVISQVNKNNNGSHFLGSRMVDKVMNARRMRSN